MLCTIVIVVTWSCGFASGTWAAWRVQGRLNARLARVQAITESIRELENRRIATDSGRDHLVRAEAGAPARISEGFVTKPGSLARYHRDSGDA